MELLDALCSLSDRLVVLTGMVPGSQRAASGWTEGLRDLLAQRHVHKCEEILVAVQEETCESSFRGPPHA